MNKNEFLAFSLPYELYLISKSTNNIASLIGLSYGNSYLVRVESQTGIHFPLPLNQVKPILHPLSDLTKPITHKGETFVPAMLLSKMVAGIHNDDLDSEWIIKDNGSIICKTPWDLRIEIYYKTSEICFSVYNTWNQAEKRTIYQLSAFQKLISWHFDIAKLIEKGEAIDINTLNENPYE